MPETPELLTALLGAAAPSGYEAPASRVWREAASFAAPGADGLGSSFARIGDDGAAPVLAVFGHIDEIGLAITHVDEKGFLYFSPIGGWDPQVLVGQRMEIQGRNGPVVGVIGRDKPIHVLRDEEKKQAVELRNLHIDIGAADRDAAFELVAIGDPVVIAGGPVAIGDDGRLVSRAMDNRLGAYVALEALRRCHERGELRGQMVAVAAVQEEIGLHGALTSAYALEPDLAVAIDVTHATDSPGIEEKELGSHPLGSGPVISRGSTLSPHVFKLLRDTAERLEIDHTVEATGRATHTDADAVQVSRSGVPAGLVSVPVRYMHSPVEMVDLGDLEATVELVTAFAGSLEPGLDLSR
ncbi:MAG: M42 family metallopeptidase [Solirubrobacterales bacterium]